jgi:hypothetical protein
MTLDRSEAERLGKELLAAILRNEEVSTSDVLTLGILWQRYRSECVAFLDNTPRSQKDAEGHAEISGEARAS